MNGGARSSPHFSDLRCRWGAALEPFAGLAFTLTLGVSYAGQFANDLQDNAVKGRLTWLF